ncbi:hypothetical protein NBRC10513_004205 [Rhodotorula toruloides]|uniref:Ubiquitin-like domain-containing protein n=1 Tax=Rhodotorula toruloides TaxID=5286 RepID=A0A2T0AC16_RHOTO|nr:hypothetical protein AAT19DRAFT_13592 [Rhodotorula toruloides]
MTSPTTSNKRAASPPPDPLPAKRVHSSKCPSRHTAVLICQSRGVIASVCVYDYQELLRDAVSLFKLPDDRLLILERDVPRKGWQTLREYSEENDFERYPGQTFPLFRISFSSQLSPADERPKYLTERDKEEWGCSISPMFYSSMTEADAYLTVYRPSAVGYGALPKPLSLMIKTLPGRQIPIEWYPQATVLDLKYALAASEGVPVDQQSLKFYGKHLEDGRTLCDHGVEHDSSIYMILNLRGGKPVIYLFPPTPLDSASVSVTLTPEWHFSALYPVVDPVKRGEGETSASWTVFAQPDGSLVDLASGLELKYLFWEAEAYKTTSSTPSHLVFDPSNPSLDASNGCALPFTSFLAHLDKTLAALSLHTAARNDFITYWLSHFTRIRDAGQHIGFRFLAQSDYERAARLDVDPKPDVVTRVFLLFKGVGAEEASEWKKPGEVDWVKELGIQVEKVEDKPLFRVLEWGGMEVV